MTIELLGVPNQTYGTRGLSYVASSLGIVTVNTSAAGYLQDIQDLLNNGCVFNVATDGILLGRLIGANMNSSSADQPFSMTRFSQLGNFRITKITAKNASISLTTAAGGIYTAASQGGTAVVANTQVYTGLSAATLALDLTIATTPGKTVWTPQTALFLNLTTAQGAAATADFYVWGDLYD